MRQLQNAFRMVCWLVAGKSVKDKLSQINTRRFQTLQDIEMNQ